MPRACRCAAGPMPDSCSSTGELTAPAARMTSPRAAIVSRPSGPKDLDAAGAPAFQKNTGRLRPSEEGHVRALEGWPQEGFCGRHAPAVLGRDLVDPDTLLRAAVEIGVEREAGLAGRLDETTRQRMQAGRYVADMHGAARAAPEVRTRLVVLERLEDWQHVLVGPAGVALRRPSVEIAWVPADPDHGVDRTRPAEQLAARPEIDLAGKRRIGFCTVVPVDRTVVEGAAVAERHLHEQPSIGAASLDDGDGETAVRRQSVGQDAACRAGPDDDEVE